jgi:transcriptional regulator with XRE-family HTH domain
MTDGASSFAQRLRQLRERADISQYRLAKLSGVTKQTLSNLESGLGGPSWETVRRLVAALGVAYEDFAVPELVMPPAADAAPRGRGRPRSEQAAAKRTRKGM